jgi:hypothetical protein
VAKLSPVHPNKQNKTIQLQTEPQGLRESESEIEDAGARRVECVDRK